MFYKSLLGFLTFVNCEGSYLAKKFLQNILCPCFDFVFAPLVVISGTRNKFIEIVAVAERYLIITRVKKKKESKK